MVDSIGPYFLGESLGEGNFSKVRLGIHKSTKEKVAIKIISKQLCLLEETTREQIQKEIFILCLLKNPNVLRLYDVYETEKELFLVMEYADKSDLFVRLSEKKMFTPNEALRYFQQLIFGLEYCHAHLVVHRDLKLENLLLNQKGQLKIGDFGMARLMKSNSLLETSCGSPHYASPEVIEGKRYDGTKSDVWSCGVILFTLLTGRLPFHDNNVVQLFKKVRTRQFMLPKNLSKDQVDLICRMLTIDPDRRISIPEIKQHKWFRSNFPDNYEPPNVIIRKSIANYYSLSTSNMDLISSFKTLNISQAKNLRKILTNPQITPDHSLFQEFQEFPELQNSNLFIDDSRNQESVEPQKNGIELDVDQDNVAKKENSNEIKHDEWVEIDFNEFPKISIKASNFGAS
ncbi:serine/threonine-protein kinase gin4-related [Anaeramoeba ignava]|uniref:Serine/threonine-protein kinase gin4-related n=1 Tax=Anaeramoeba ignava TaxID=1746090 RepID=A0A9Q0LVS8_ANAIG|nr:serine/threonine-protein kinase gin4-related [Anaeramoeba ignava]